MFQYFNFRWVFFWNNCPQGGALNSKLTPVYSRASSWQKFPFNIPHKTCLKCSITGSPVSAGQVPASTQDKRFEDRSISPGNELLGLVREDFVLRSFKWHVARKTLWGPAVAVPPACHMPLDTETCFVSSLKPSATWPHLCHSHGTSTHSWCTPPLTRTFSLSFFCHYSWFTVFWQFPTKQLLS